MRKLNFILLLLCVRVSFADYFEAPMLVSDWELAQSKTMCQLTHKIPFYGRADFTQRAGGILQFSVQEQRNKPNIIKANLATLPAPWIHDEFARHEQLVFLEEAVDIKGRGRLAVYGAAAEAMMDALMQGHYPVFTYVREAGDLNLEESRVAVSAIKFAERYEVFLKCRNALLPFAADEVQNQRIYFNTASKRLDKQAKKSIRNIADYVNKINGSQVLIGSDTADVGRADKKWFDSRANAVTERLVSEGVGEDRIKKMASLPIGVNKKNVRIHLMGPDTLTHYLFKKGSIRLSPLDRYKLDLLADYIKSYFHQGRIVVRSYTDSKGSRKNNLNVSKRRGGAVEKYLLSRGVSGNRITVKAYGEDFPARSNRFRKGQAQNRRVEIDLLG